jgi:NADH-quinone oxidoreductase subunit C
MGSPAESKPPTPPAAPAAPKPPAKPAAPAVMEATPWEGELPDLLKAAFPDKISEFSEYRGQKFLVCPPETTVPILEFLKLEGDFDYLVDVTAVDWPKREPRFDLVYIIYSFARNERIRMKTRLALGQKTQSAVGVHLTADWLEREVFDMFGIEFEGHPDLKRILMPDGWEGFPLRKDYGITQMDNRWIQENMGIESAQ